MMNITRRHIVTFLAVAACGISGGTAQAQGLAAYPAKPVTLVVPYPPGGDTDAIARLLGERLAARLKKPVVIDNRPGAGGVIGNAYVSKAAPDGYTLLFTPNPFTTAPMVMRLSPAASYDPLNGFMPVIKTAVQPLVLVTHPGTGLRSVPEMIAAAKAGRLLSYASPGAGSPMHIVAEWLNKEAGVHITHVPYRGVGPEVSDVVAGHVDTAWVTLGAVSQYVKAGKLIELAIADARRSPLAPEVPTLVEAGYKDVIVGAWNGVFAPKGTPKEVVALLNAQFNEIIRQPDVVERFALFGAQPAGGAPEVLERTNAAEYEIMGRVIRDLNLYTN